MLCEVEVVFSTAKSVRVLISNEPTVQDGTVTACNPWTVAHGG